MTKFWTNNKNGNTYEIIDDDVIDATNKSDDAEMVLYKEVDASVHQLYVREKSEFLEKFTEKK